MNWLFGHHIIQKINDTPVYHVAYTRTYVYTGRPYTIHLGLSILDHSGQGH
jgi:hypothetical protein